MRARRLRGRRQRRAPPRHLAQPAGRRAGRRTAPRRAPPGTSRAPARRRAARAAARRRAAAAAPRCRGCGRTRSGPRSSVDPRALQLVERRRPRRSRAAPSAASGAPASSFACAAASARAPRRAGSGVSSAARSRNAAAAASAAARLRPAGRALQLVGHLLVGPRPPRARDARPADRGPARVGRLGQRAVDLAALGRGRRPVDGRAHQRMAEPHPRADLDQARRLAPAPPRRARSRAARPRATAASRRRPARPPPAAAAAASRPGAARAGARSPARSGPPAAARRAGRTRRPARVGVNPRGSSSSASGLPRGLGEDPVPHPLVQRPGDRRVQQRAGVLVAQPLDHQLRQPAERGSSPARAPRTPARPARPAAGAPRTPASAPTPGRATGRRRRRRPAAAPPPRRPAGSAPPARPGSGPAAVPALRPNAVPSASRCGPGRRPSRSSIGAQSCMQAGERELHLGLDARRRHDPAPRRAAAR